MGVDPAGSEGLGAAADRPPDVVIPIEPGHGSSLQGGLARLEQRLGKPWSVQALSTCLGLALVLCWIAYFLGWGLGGSGALGNRPMLADPDQPARFLSGISAIAFPLTAMLLGRWLGRLERRMKLRLVRRRRRRPQQLRKRLRLADFERHYRWLLGLVVGTLLVAVLIGFRRGDVAAFAIVFSWLALGPVSGIAMARRFSSPTSQGVAALIAGFGSITGAVLVILAFAGAGVSAFAFGILGITNVAFAGALGVLLEMVMGGVFTLGLAIAGAGVATVALALAGAGTGMATLTGVATLSRAGLAASAILMGGAALATLAFREAAVFAAVIGGISALAVAAAVSHNRMGHRGAYAGAIGAIGLLSLAAILFGWGDRPLVIFAVCFFFLLPVPVGLAGWVALASLRNLMAGLSVLRPGPLTLLTGWIAAGLITLFLTLALPFSLGFSAGGYDQLVLAWSGRPAFEITPMIARAVDEPAGEGLWLSLLLLTPLLPLAVITSHLVTDGLLALQPYDYRLRRVLFRSVSIALTATVAGLLIWLITVSDGDLAPLFGRIAEAGWQEAGRLWNAPHPPSP